MSCGCATQTDRGRSLLASGFPPSFQSRRSLHLPHLRCSWLETRPRDRRGSVPESCSRPVSLDRIRHKRLPKRPTQRRISAFFSWKPHLPEDPPAEGLVVRNTDGVGLVVRYATVDADAHFH